MQVVSVLVLFASQLALSLRSTSLESDYDVNMRRIANGDHLSDQEFEMVALQSEEKAKQSCEDYINDMHGALDMVKLTFIEHNETSGTDLDSEVEKKTAKSINAILLALGANAYSKNCLMPMYQDTLVQQKLDELLTVSVDAEKFFETCEGRGARCREAYEKMVIWQHGVLTLNDTIFDDPELSTDISKHCPHQCSWCSREHKSLYKKDEHFKFKCFLKGSEMPKYGKNLKCSQPSRRMTKFWRKKTWCEVPEWKERVVRQNKVSAVIGCSMLLLQPGVQEKPVVDLAVAHKTCLNFEQGIVVTESEYDKYNSTFFIGRDKNSPVDASLVVSLQTLGVQAGLAELIRISKIHAHEQAHSLIRHFHRSRAFPIEGGEVFFLGPLANSLQYDVCALPSRGGLFGGLLFSLFRMSLQMWLWPLGMVLSSPLMVVTFLSILWGVLKMPSVHSVVLLPLTLISEIWSYGTWVWSQLGKLLRTSPYDCDPAKLMPGRAVDAESVLARAQEPQCLAGMYHGRSTCVQGVTVMCQKEHGSNLIVVPDKSC